MNIDVMSAGNYSRNYTNSNTTKSTETASFADAIEERVAERKTESGQLVFDECRYEYQAIITNIDYLSTAEIFNDYNQRCTVETSIDEIKSGFAFSENSQIDHKCNELYLLIKMIACKPKTIEKWVNLYNRGGMDAPAPKTRCDKGGTRVITSDAEPEIRRLKKEYPRLNATQIHDRLVQEGILPATVSVSSVRRYIKNNGLRGGERLPVKDRKAFEAAFFS